MTEFLLFIQSSKLQRILFFLLILFLPTQFGKHFWPDFAFVFGQRIDYLSPTLYFTDVLSLVFILLSLPTLSLPKGETMISIIFFLFLSFGIFFSHSPFAGWYYLVKLIEFVLLGFAIRNFLSQQKTIAIILYPLAMGIVFESFLALWQFFSQSSIGGLFYFLGERAFNGDTPGIANASLNGQLLLRPYGTFSHPNVLAGYLVIAMTIVLSSMYFVSSIKRVNISSSSESQQIEKRSLFPTSSRLRIHFARTILFFLVLLLGTIALFLTLSRIAIILWLLILCYKLMISFKKFLRFQILTTSYLLLAIAICGIFFLTPLHYRFLLSFTNESLTDRILLMRAAWYMIIRYPLFGVGFGNFFPELPIALQQYHHNSVILLQPVHNIFFLIAAETGIIGLFFVLWFLYKTFRQIILSKNNLGILLLCCVLFLGQFDHYSLTLQQGQLLLTLVMAICWSKKARQNATIEA